MESTKLVCAVSGELFNDLARNIRLVVTLDVDFDNIRVVLILVSNLIGSEPAGLYKLDPAVIAEDCTNEGLHLSHDDLIRFHIP